MSTRAIIAVEIADGSYLASTVAESGDDGALATTLETYFDTPAKAQRVASLGDIKSITADSEVTYSLFGEGPSAYPDIEALDAGKPADVHHLHIYSGGWEHRLDDVAQWQRVLADLSRFDTTVPYDTELETNWDWVRPTTRGTGPVAASETAKVITYEGAGTDVLREDDATWRSELRLPGERVRIDYKAAGDSREALALRLRHRPLEVSRTVVRGEERTDEGGYKYTAVVNEYEFRGVEGRFTAQHFQQERGEQQGFGAMIVDRDRLLFVPLSEQDRSVAGPPRRVTAIDSMLKGPLDGMRSIASAKDFFRGHPAAGDFTFRPETYSRTEGAVELVAASLMTALGVHEERLAREAIAEVAPKNGSPLGAAARAALATDLER